MTGVEIERLTATAHLPPDTAPGVADRIDGLLRVAAGKPLDDALAAAGLPEGIWCLRRVDARLRLDLERVDAALAGDWARTLSAAVAAALGAAPTAGRADVVVYPDVAAATADLVAELGAGRSDRAWAWRAAGLLASSDPDPAYRPGAAILAVLARRPERTLGALVAAVRTTGIEPLHRVLGRDGWTALADLVDSASGVDTVGSVPPAAPGATAGSGAVPATATSAPDVEVAHRLARRLIARSRLADALRNSRIRPDERTLAAWARIVVASADPSTARRTEVAAVTARIADVVAGRATPDAAPARRGTPPTPTAEDAGTNAMVREPLVPSAQPGTAGTADVEPQDSPGPPVYPTAWAGALFLLATTEAAGIPDPVSADPRLAARPLTWAVGRAVHAYGVPPGDPALAVLTGRDPAEPDPWDGDDEEPDETAAVVELAQAWEQVTRDALGAGPDAAGRRRFREMLRRPGTVLWSPGWVEVALPLDAVELDVRQAGLDLDPGWVPWLGSVVRYRYG